ncbi:MAG: PD40 domain-containing protein [Candidatus Aminicenantes bacterium]|nr:PD40 domain-containing protein [Candidatus Aminicenantes bacterium]
MKFYFKVFVFTLCFFALLTSEFGEIKEIDISNVELGKKNLLCENAFAPRWSPDGTQILYTAINRNNFEIWKMNSDGSNKEFIVKGMYGFWSPDGKRIAYLVFSRKHFMGHGIYCLNVYDFKKQKVLYRDSRKFSISDNNMIKEFRYPTEFYWSSDNVRIVHSFLINTPIRDVESRAFWILNINNLRWTISNDRKLPQLYDSIIMNNKHQNINIEVVPPYIPKNQALDKFFYSKIKRNLKSIDEYKYFFGVWAVNKDETQSMKLLTNAMQPELSPILNKLVYVKLGTGSNSDSSSIFISEMKNTGLNLKSYIVDLGEKSGVRIGDKFIIVTPRINPLNNKIIGYLEPIKAVVKVKAVKDTSCLVQIEILIRGFNRGDLAVCGRSGNSGLLKEESSLSEFVPVFKEDSSNIK